MDLKRLRTFVAVAELGTVSRAALRLRISQSALSRQIGDLEQELGFRLFDRVGRGCLDRGRRAVAWRMSRSVGPCRCARRAGRSAQAWRQRGAEGCRPAADDRKVLSTFLPRYAERFPNVHVKLTEALGPSSPRCWNAERFTSALGTIEGQSTLRESHVAAG